MERGYIKLYRKALDSGLIQHARAWQLLSWMLLTATHRPLKACFNGVLFSLDPGQLVTSRSDVCAKLRMTPKEYRTAVEFLEKAEFTASKGASKGTVFTILNWATYQHEGPADGQQKGQVGAKYGPAEEPASRNIQEQENKKKESITAPNPDGFRAESGTLVCDKSMAKVAGTTPPRNDLTAYYLPVKSPEMAEVAFLKAENWQVWESIYGHDFCLEQLRKAYKWCLDTPGKAKTAKGVHKFFGTWLENEQNRHGSGSARASPSRPHSANREDDPILKTMGNAANVLQRRKERDNANAG